MCVLPHVKPWLRSIVMYQIVKLMIGVIVLKQFQKFVKVKNGTPFKNSLFFYFMLIHHLSSVEHGVTIRERAHRPNHSTLHTILLFGIK